MAQAGTRAPEPDFEQTAQISLNQARIWDFIKAERALETSTSMPVFLSTDPIGSQSAHAKGQWQVHHRKPLLLSELPFAYSSCT